MRRWWSLNCSSDGKDKRSKPPGHDEGWLGVLTRWRIEEIKWNAYFEKDWIKLIFTECLLCAKPELNDKNEESSGNGQAIRLNGCVGLREGEVDKKLYMD